MRARTKRNALVAAAVLAIALAAAFCYQQHAQQQAQQQAAEREAYSLASDAARLMSLYTDVGVVKWLHMGTVEDAYGNAVPRADLDAMETGELEAVVDAYNADPQTESPSRWRRPSTA